MEILDLAGNFHREIVSRKIFDIVDSAYTVHEVVPECVYIISDRGNDAHTCYYYSFCHICCFILQATGRFSEASQLRP